MTKYSKRQYEGVIDHQDTHKIELLKSIIPTDTNTIIDIGCGNGLITNELAKDYDILGVDVNPSKIEHVKTDKLLSSCDNIDRPNESYDMVFSSELLEHLDEDLLNRTLTEFERLASSYILITVPNNEQLEKLVIKCEACHHEYHKNGHLHKFDKIKLNSLFRNFEQRKVQEFGKKVRGYNKRLAQLKHSITPPSSWIPKMWINNSSVNFSYCTNCGNKNEIKTNFHPVSRGLDLVNIIFSSKKPEQLLALYKKV